MTSSSRSLSVGLRIGLGVVLCVGQLFAQQDDSLAARKIAALSHRLQRQDSTARDRDTVAAAIRAELKSFIESSIRPTETEAVIRQRVSRVLRTQVPDFEFSEAPKIRQSNVRYGSTLVVSYSVIRPPHFDLPTITAFTEVNGEFRQLDSSPDDFEGFSLFTLDIPSSSKETMWILAGGRAFTFNGSKFRFRLYAFDGNRFETLWSTDDVFDASVQVLPDGFSLTHYVRQLPSTVTEQYKSTLSGVVRIR